MLHRCDLLRTAAHAPAATLAATGRRCDSRVGPLPRISVCAGASSGSTVLPASDLAFDTDDLVLKLTLLQPTCVCLLDCILILVAVQYVVSMNMQNGVVAALHN